MENGASSTANSSSSTTSSTSLPQSIEVNSETGQVQLCFGDLKYQLVPGSIATENELLLGNGIVFSEHLTQAQKAEEEKGRNLIDKMSEKKFQCVICRAVESDQKDFYFHLKDHYETEEKKNPVIIRAQEKKKSKKTKKEEEEDPQQQDIEPTPKRKKSKHRCPICEKEFLNQGYLNVHQRIHSGIKPYKCQECRKDFRQLGDLKYHQESIHNELKDHQCEFCGKEFSRKYSLTIHRRIHTGEKTYVCEYCNKGFRASIYLTNHRRIHTGEKPYPCDICGRSFRLRPDMSRHRQNVHLRRPKLAPTKEEEEVVETVLVTDQIYQATEAPEQLWVTEEEQNQEEVLTSS